MILMETFMMHIVKVMTGVKAGQGQRLERAKDGYEYLKIMLMLLCSSVCGFCSRFAMVSGKHRKISTSITPPNMVRVDPGSKHLSLALDRVHREGLAEILRLLYLALSDLRYRLRLLYSWAGRNLQLENN